MSKLSTEDVLSTASRVGWAVTPERARQIAATAGPAVEKFAEVRARLSFDDDTLTLQKVRESVKQRD